MIPRPPRSTRTDTLFPYTPLFRTCWASLADAAFPYQSGRSETVHRFFHKGSPTMSAKDVKFSRDAREGIARGVDILANAVRSEDRRVGKECVSRCRSRWSPLH